MKDAAIILLLVIIFWFVYNTPELKQKDTTDYKSLYLKCNGKLLDSALHKDCIRIR